MPIDNFFGALLSWNFILFSLGIAVAIWMFRTVLDYFWPAIDGFKFWNALVLPLLPPGLGGFVGYIAKNYAYPAGLTSLSGRLLFGIVAGACSGLCFQVVKGMLKDRVASYIRDIDSPNMSSTTTTNATITTLPTPTSTTTTVSSTATTVGPAPVMGANIPK